MDACNDPGAGNPGGLDGLTDCGSDAVDVCDNLEPVFDGLAAWFSTSVTDARKRLWEDNGGEEIEFDAAEFIFSEDAEANDTIQLYNSTSYLDECLAIFHPKYIEECVKAKSRLKVTVGNYFLPPVEIQKYVRANDKMAFTWEDTPKVHVCNRGSPSQKSPQHVSVCQDELDAHPDEPHTIHDAAQSDFLSIDKLETVFGAIDDVTLWKDGYEVYYLDR